MKLGASTFNWVSPFTDNDFNIVKKVKEIGYDIIEVAVEDAEAVDWIKLKELALQYDLTITLSGVFGQGKDISNEDETIRKQGMKYITDCIKVSEKIGCKLFVGPIYSYVGKTRFIGDEQKKREREFCINNIKKIGRLAQDSGVVIGVEPLNRFENDMINTADQAIALVKEVDNPNIKIILDTFHCNIEEKDIPAAIRRVGKELLCHIHGNESDRGIPGSGHTNWTGIRDALTEINYDGAVVLESFGSISEEIARACFMWRPLAKSPDDLARGGYEFYKSLF
jgi:D-psicose/D-tagatose/L-ribulose 3-epimerase